MNSSWHTHTNRLEKIDVITNDNSPNLTKCLTRHRTSVILTLATTSRCSRSNEGSRWLTRSTAAECAEWLSCTRPVNTSSQRHTYLPNTRRLIIHYHNTVSIKTLQHMLSEVCTTHLNTRCQKCAQHTMSLSEVFTTHLNTRCQIVTPSLNCQCVTSWSGVVHSVKSRKYCVYLSAVSVYRSRQKAHLHSISGK